MTRKTLAEVTLHNYRSHEHSVIELGPLTLFIGENGYGKSHIFNAIDMVLTNSPFPDGALRYGTKDAYVRVKFHDGTWIERHRNGSKQKAILFDGKKTSEYATIKDIGGIVEEFTGFKNVVLDRNTKPESVQLIPLDASQRFMVVGTSPEVIYRRIQRLIHGAGIETAKLQLEKELRVLVTKAESDQKELDKCDRIIETLDAPLWTEAAESVDVVEEAVKQMKGLDTRLGLLDEVYELLSHIDRNAHYRAVMAEVDALFEEIEAAQARREEIERDDVKGELESIKTLLDTIDKSYVEVEGIDKEIAELEPIIAQLEEQERERLVREQLEREAAERTAHENLKANGPEPFFDAPESLVLDTIDCLEAFSNPTLAKEIAGDWRNLCQQS